MLNLRDCTAVITGASSGLGAEFARQLAPQAKALALVARRETELTKLAEELQRTHPALRIAVIPCDLADPDARAQLPGHLTSLGFRVNVLINNAGLGDYGGFAEGVWPKIDLVMQVNMTALAHLSHLFLPDLKTSAPSGILNVSSLAGELPMPDIAIYSATKAFVSRFSEALRIELRPERIEVCALCPGPVKTGFGAVAERTGGKTPKVKAAYMPMERVVAAGLRALSRGRARVFPGFLVRTIWLLVNTLPMPIIRLLLSGRPRRPRPAV
ncbi:MAG TPA: SDR family oxidoreductase [Verrucomicrobiales bacterium]|nr:SDR family oxidoreductase [Verrucomicrobiales bacterium]